MTLRNGLLTLLLFAFATIQAQNPSKYKDDQVPRLGIKGGLSMASIIKTNGSGFSSTPLYGFNGGLVFQLPLGDVISLQPELLFSQKGYHATGSTFIGGYDYKRFLNFLDIPLLLRISPIKTFGIVLGPQYSYLLSTKTSFNTGNAAYVQTVNNENNSITKNIFGGVIGVDVNVNSFLFVYGRYTLDFKNNNGDGTSSTPAYKNQVFQVGAGFLFN